MKKSCPHRLISSLAIIAWLTECGGIAVAEETGDMDHDAVVAIEVNGQPAVDFARVWVGSRGQIYGSTTTFAQLRLVLPSTQPVLRNGEEYYSLGAPPNLQVALDSPTQTVRINAPGSAFVSSKYDGSHSVRFPAQAGAPGGFANYDIAYAGAPGSRNVSALVELGAFVADGTLTSRSVRSNLSNRPRLFRLDSQFVRDFPDQMAALVVGDAISGLSSWSRQLYFGGVQWRTKFATRPDFQPLSMPTLSGVAAAPSSVDLYVDNVLRMRQQVDAGPFTITNLPALTGQGIIQTVVRDVLGREQLLNQRYILSPLLLQQGAQDLSLEAGGPRVNYGSPDSYYGSAFGSATLRYGITNSLTLEAHGEGRRGSAALGGGVAMPLGDSYLLSGGMAVSQSERRTGGLVHAQLERQNRSFGFAAKVQLTDQRFWQLGLENSELAPARQLQAQASAAITANTTISLSYLDQANRSKANVRGLTGAVTMNLGALGTLAFSYTRYMQNGASAAASMIWTIPMGVGRVAQFGLAGSPGHYLGIADYQQAIGMEGGLGYRARQSLFDRSGTDIGATYLGSAIQVGAEANRVNHRDTTLIQARGGIALLDGHLIASRWLDESFAVVEVPIREPVDIYADNVKFGHTNASGIGFIPRLMAYQNNVVRLGDAKLPLDASLDLNERAVVLKQRSGVVLKFAAAHLKSATLLLVDASGAALPPGASVSVEGQSHLAEVALRGEVFIPEIDFPARVSARWDDRQCAVLVQPPPRVGPLPRLGPLTCR